MAALCPLLPIEPLPVYTPRAQTTANAETASIRSGAPSYSSDAPSYHSSLSRRTSISRDAPPTQRTAHATSGLATATSTTPARIGLPRMEYAPGFHLRQTPSPPSCDPLEPFPSRASHLAEASLDRSNSLEPNLSNRRPALEPSKKGRAVISIALDYSRHQPSSRVTCHVPSSSSPLPRGPGRRSTLESDLFTNASPSSLATSESKVSQSSGSRSKPTTQAEPPVSPLEDPELVGTEAAAIARDQRLFLDDVRRGVCRFTEEETTAMRKQEAKTWDFMFAQMADWEERDRSWQRYSNRIGNKKSRVMSTRGSLRLVDRK